MSIVLTGSGYKHTIREQRMYSDATPMIKVDDFEEMVKRADTIIVRAEGLMEFVNAMFLVDAIDASDFDGPGVNTLILPYIPGARQDRSNPTGDVLLTLHSVAEMINTRMFERVVVLDPHSPESTRIINNVVSFPLELVGWANDAELRTRRFDGIIAADKGGQARAEEMAVALRVPVFYGGKTRDVSTGRLSGFTLESIPKGHYLVADDICDGGGTFIGLADKIREQGSTADLYVTHGIFSKGVEDLLKAYSTIYTTDSLAGSERDNQVTVLAVVEEMEKYNE